MPWNKLKILELLNIAFESKVPFLIKLHIKVGKIKLLDLLVIRMGKGKCDGRNVWHAWGINVDKVVVRKRTLRRSRCRWDDNITVDKQDEVYAVN